MPPVPRSLRKLGNAALDLYGGWRSNRYDARQSIGVFCTGRGGSTWLAQIVASAPKHHMLWEPLHWKTDPEARSRGFGEPRYIPRGKTLPEAEAHVRSVLEGKTLSRVINSSRYFHPLDLLRVDAYVVKFVTATMMLPWISDTFGLRSIHMVRHPCAVVSSQLVHGAWDDVEKSFIEHPVLFEDYPHLGSIFDRITSHEEILAFNWAIQNWIPLSANPQKWLTTTYERLVDQGLDEVNRLFRGLDLDMPSEARRMLQTPSATTIEKDERSKSTERLARWRSHLTPRQVDLILSIVHEVGITGYSDELRPSTPLVDA